MFIATTWLYYKIFMSKKDGPEIDKLREIVAILRSPNGCPWDKKQTHMSLRYNAIEEAYELVESIEKKRDDEIIEELGDLLLQVVLHAQIAQERGAFDFDKICSNIREKLIRRHPHVFGDKVLHDVDGVWSQWEALKLQEKKGTESERKSVFDGIPKHLPSLLYAEKVLKKAKRIGIFLDFLDSDEKYTKETLGRKLFALVYYAYSRKWSAEALLRSEVKKIENKLRKLEASKRQEKSAEGTISNHSNNTTGKSKPRKQNKKGN